MCSSTNAHAVTLTHDVMVCRLQMTEAALALSEQKNHNLGELLTRVKAEKEEQRERQSRERRKEQEVRTDGTMMMTPYMRF